MISTALQFTPKASRLERLEALANQLVGIGGSRSIGFGPERVLSGPDGLGKALLQIVDIHKGQYEKGNGYRRIDSNEKNITENEQKLRVGLLEKTAGNLCLACGNNTLVHQEGCAKCYSCGESEC